MMATRTTRCWKTGLALAAGLLLSACAAAEPEDPNGRIVDLPQTWDEIDIGEADLDLPLTSPLEIDELRERVGAYQLFENYYTFHGVNGFLVTSRVFFGKFALNPTREVRDAEDFLRFAKGLSVVERRKLRVGSAKPFKLPEQRSEGFYTKAISEQRDDDCFIFRVGYLLAGDRTPGGDAMDTIVIGQLCGDDLDEAALLGLLARMKVVEDRDQFREALSRRKIGTI